MCDIYPCSFPATFNITETETHSAPAAVTNSAWWRKKKIIYVNY